MLGYPIAPATPMSLVFLQFLRASGTRASRLARLAVLFLIFHSSFCESAFAQQLGLPAKQGGVAELEAKSQSRKGDVTSADGDVDIHLGDTRLRADHVEYNGKTYETVASGHVQLDYNNEHIEATEAHYNVSTGYGLFHNVHGTVKIERHPNPAVLLSGNPLYFEARDVERFSGDVYLIHRAWITVCDFEHPKWQFYAPSARIHVGKSVALINANFRLFHVPLVWMPYATAPAGTKVRQSGILVPDIGQSSRKGFTVGDAFYFAPKPWMDATFGFQFMSSRGLLERGEFRAKPWENTSIHYTYFGVDDRGLANGSGIRVPQGGEQQRVEVQSLLPGGWRFVADYNQLSSLTFRLAFADTFGEATNSEVRSAIFMTNNFRGFSFNVASLNDKTFLTLPVAAIPATSVSLRNMPEVRFGSVEQAPWRSLPVYFSFDTSAGFLHRTDATVPGSTYLPIDTPSYVSRIEFAPRVTVPLHFGPWFGVTASAALNSARYGDSLTSAGLVSGEPITRTTGEFSVDLRLPVFERIFDGTPQHKNKSWHRYKHTIEPVITYRYVTGVDNFANFIRFDTDATLTNTNEVQYGVTQRLYLKLGDEQPQELVSWSIVQKHFFDPTFGGAILSGQRNVFQTLDSFSPFAFAFGPRRWSPVVSDLRITPGGPYDFEQILQYDTGSQRLVTVGTLVKVKPYKEIFATVAHFRLNNNPTPGDLSVPSAFVPFNQPLSNQIRMLAGYGDETRRGLNFTTGIGYDFNNKTLQNQIAQVSYNGSCCGLAFEYLRINLGQVRTENQFKVAFIIANIGTFGNLRHRDRIF